jgi:hypothetical protein
MKTSNRIWIPRILFSLAVLLSGLALTPYVEMPRQRLGWQLYAGMYEPLFTVNHPSGQPGSYFTLRGSNFPTDSAVYLTVYHSNYGTRPLASVTTDGTGQFTQLILTSGSPVGAYTVTATANPNASATTNFLLDSAAPQWPQEDQGPIVRTLGNLYAPAVFRNYAP